MRSHSLFLIVIAMIAGHASNAHEYSGPHGKVLVDWQTANVSRITSSGYGDAFGVEASVKMGFPEPETIDGKECINGSYFLSTS